MNTNRIVAHKTQIIRPKTQQNRKGLPSDSAHPKRKQKNNNTAAAHNRPAKAAAATHHIIYFAPTQMAFGPLLHMDSDDFCIITLFGPERATRTQRIAPLTSTTTLQNGRRRLCICTKESGRPYTQTVYRQNACNSSRARELKGKRWPKNHRP